MILKTVIISLITFEVVFVIKEVKKFDVRRVYSYELKEDLRKRSLVYDELCKKDANREMSDGY